MKPHRPRDEKSETVGDIHTEKKEREKKRNLGGPGEGNSLIIIAIIIIFFWLKVKLQLQLFRMNGVTSQDRSPAFWMCTDARLVRQRIRYAHSAPHTRPCATLNADARNPLLRQF